MSFKTIIYEGKEVRAFDFLMKKENALDIISGKKKVETRSYSPFYYRLIHDKEQDELNKKDTDNFVPPIRDDISFIHFHNYNNSWFLNVRISEIGVGKFSEQYLKELSKEFDFNDFDNEWQQFENLSDEDKPVFYWFAIKEIVNHNL